MNHFTWTNEVWHSEEIMDKPTSFIYVNISL
jgi:hypothetical protein